MHNEIVITTNDELKKLFEKYDVMIVVDDKVKEQAKKYKDINKIFHDRIKFLNITCDIDFDLFYRVFYVVDNNDPKTLGSLKGISHTSFNNNKNNNKSFILLSDLLTFVSNSSKNKKMSFYHYVGDNVIETDDSEEIEYSDEDISYDLEFFFNKGREAIYIDTTLNRFDYTLVEKNIMYNESPVFIQENERHLLGMFFEHFYDYYNKHAEGWGHSPYIDYPQEAWLRNRNFLEKIWTNLNNNKFVSSLENKVFMFDNDTNEFVLIKREQYLSECPLDEDIDYCFNLETACNALLNNARYFINQNVKEETTKTQNSPAQNKSGLSETEVNIVTDTQTEEQNNTENVSYFYNISNNMITIIEQNGSNTDTIIFNNSEPYFDEINDLLVGISEHSHVESQQKLQEAFIKCKNNNVKDAVKEYVKTYFAKHGYGNIELDFSNGLLEYVDTAGNRTEFMSACLVDRLCNLVRSDNSTNELSSLMEFTKRVMNCGNNDSINSLYDFIKHNDLKIESDGSIIAWKFVNEDYTDCFTSTIDNSPGMTPWLPRGAVDPDRNRTCSKGLHVCSLEYLLSGWGKRFVKVRVYPEDVVSVPYDYNGSKARVCKYHVIADCTDEVNKLKSNK